MIQQRSKSNYCPICHSQEIKTILTTQFLTIKKCISCSVYFVDPYSHQSKLKDYYEKYNFNNYINYYKPFRLKTYKKNWERILGWKKSGSCLDLGTSFGWFVDAKPREWKAIGLEPSKKLFNYIKKSRPFIKLGDENQLLKSKKTYDLITMWNVMEHIQKPNKTLQIIHRRLKTNGLLAISVPNRYGLINLLGYIAYFITFKKISQPLYSLFQIESSSPHLFHYSPKSLTYVLERNGFKPLIIEGQQIIDITNLDGRFQLEYNAKIANKQLIKWFLVIFYYLAKLLKMYDEIVIYAIKVK